MTSLTSQYQPFATGISSITQNGSYSLVTTSVPNGFVIGSEVLFQIPQQWGMKQLNGLTGYVTAVTSNTITVNINTATFDPFTIPVNPLAGSPAQVLPIGDENSGFQSIGNVVPTNLSIPGAYIAPTTP